MRAAVITAATAAVIIVGVVVVVVVADAVPAAVVSDSACVNLSIIPGQSFFSSRDALFSLGLFCVI